MNPYPFFAELLIRLQLESPRFFRRLQLIFYPLAGIAQIFTGLRDMGFVFPAELNGMLSQTTAVVLFFAGVLSTLPVKDSNKLHRHLSEKTDR